MVGKDEMDTATEHSRIDLLRHLSTRLDAGGEADIAEILALTRRLLGVSSAFVARIEGPRYIVEHAADDANDTKAGQVCQLGKTMPVLTRRADSVVIADRSWASDHWGHPCDVTRQSETYIGVALRMEKTPYGTLDFCDPRPRKKPFSPDDIELVRLAGRWIEGAIGQRRLRGHVNDIISAFADSNRHLRAERRAREALLAALPDLLLVVDANGLCRRAHSPSATQRGRAWNSNPLTDYLPAAAAEQVRQDVQHALQHNTAHVREHAVPSVHEQTVFEARIVPVQAEEGPPMDAVVMLRDMSDREEARRLVEQRAALEVTNTQLQSANAELETFAYAASHDMKSPLRALSNLSTWIEEEIADVDRPEATRYLGMMRERVDYLVHLVDDLLAYSRAGTVGTKLRSVRIADLVERIGQGLGVVANFTLTVTGDIKALITAEAPLERVLSNAISNAVNHHDQDSGSIVVDASSDGDRVCFRVADDGPGVPAAFREKVFGVFRRLNRIGQGTGMGLALVRKTVEGVGGQARLEGNTPRGTVLVFTWPRDWPR